MRGKNKIIKQRSPIATLVKKKHTLQNCIDGQKSHNSKQSQRDKQKKLVAIYKKKNIKMISDKL